MIWLRKEVKECVDYFKNHKGFHRFLCGLRDKYVSLSRVGGIVKLTNLSQEEKEDLQGLFPKIKEKNGTVVLSAEAFQKALLQTKYAEISLEMLLQGYFNETLESRRERMEREEQEWNQYLDNMQEPYQGTFSGKWLEKVRNEESYSSMYSFIKQHYRVDKEQLALELNVVLRGANQFPVLEGKEKSLPIFAAEISGSPHYFDEGTRANRLLYYCMEEYVHAHGIEMGGWYEDEKTYQVERRNEMYYLVGLTKDDISNRSVVYGVHLRKRSGTLHAGIEAFIEEGEPVTVMLCQMHEIKEVYSEMKKIYVFENPSVFSAFIQMVEKKNISAMCTNGQLSLTSLLLLDGLVESGGCIYYAGDFDPEGLQIGDRLKQRYGEQLILWHYGADDYEICKSSVDLNQRRLNKLKGIRSKELELMVKLLEEEKLAGYQERLIEEYVRDVVNPL